MICDLCKQPFEEPPFTIVTPEFRIENVCGECMNLYGNQMYDELIERIKSFDTSTKTVKGENNG
jgi:hypothetical protein